MGAKRISHRYEIPESYDLRNEVERLGYLQKTFLYTFGTANPQLGQRFYLEQDSEIDNSKAVAIQIFDQASVSSPVLTNFGLTNVWGAPALASGMLCLKNYEKEIQYQDMPLLRLRYPMFGFTFFEHVFLELNIRLSTGESWFWFNAPAVGIIAPSCILYSIIYKPL